MKKEYLKPDAEIIDFEIDEPIMDGFFDDSWQVGEDDEEGI